MNLWARVIPTINYIFLAVSAVFLFVVSLPLVQGSPALFAFWDLMLFVFIVFAVLVAVENFVLKEKFAATHTGVDAGLMTVIIIRNIIFVMNSMPLIQLLGLTAIFSIGWILAIIYIILLVSRFGKSKSVVQQS